MKKRMLNYVPLFGFLMLTISCGGSKTAERNIEEVVQVPSYIQTQATPQGMMYVGKADQMITSSVPLDKITSIKLAVDDGQGHNVIVAQSTAKQNNVVLLAHVSNPNLFPVRITEVSAGRLRVEIDLAFPASSSQMIQTQLMMLLIIERKE